MASVEQVSALGSLLSGLPLAEPAPSVTPAPGPSTEPFWQRFLTSAGFGGLMALTAALVAARIAALQLRHTKAQQVHERWWSTLTWVYDRAVVESDKRAALPHHVTFAMLTQLAEHARAAPGDGLQRSTIKSILSMFEASGDVYQPSATATPLPSDGGDTAYPPVIRVSDPAAATMLDDLRQRLSNDEELRTRTEQITYLLAVKAVVRRAAAALGADAAPDDAGTRADFTVAWRDRLVLVRVRYVDEPPSNPALLLAIENMQTEIAASYPAVGGLIVLNTPFGRAAGTSFTAAIDRPEVEVVTWRSEADDPSIRAALARLRPGDAPG